MVCKQKFHRFAVFFEHNNILKKVDNSQYVYQIPGSII